MLQIHLREVTDEGGGHYSATLFVDGVARDVQVGEEVGEFVVSDILNDTVWLTDGDDDDFYIDDRTYLTYSNTYGRWFLGREEGEFPPYSK